LKLARLPLSVAATLAVLPSISEIPFLDWNSLGSRSRSLLPLQLYLDHSHDPVLAPAT